MALHAQAKAQVSIYEFSNAVLRPSSILKSQLCNNLLSEATFHPLVGFPWQYGKKHFCFPWLWASASLRDLGEKELEACPPWWQGIFRAILGRQWVECWCFLALTSNTVGGRPAGLRQKSAVGLRRGTGLFLGGWGGGVDQWPTCP